jgi:hypothetical protein
MTPHGELSAADAVDDNAERFGRTSSNVCDPFEEEPPMKPPACIVSSRSSHPLGAVRRLTSGARAIAVALVLAVLTIGQAHAACTSDVQGADDQPNQKDATQFCNNGACGGTSFSLGVSFDDRSWSGTNTSDGCLLFDTDGDGLANRAVCGSLGGLSGTLQAGSPTCYTCGDTRPDRCTSSVAVACTTTCTATVTADPFSGDPNHVGNNACGGSNCLTQDTTLTCCVSQGDRGGAGGVLIDACSYPSQQPNSDPSDCVVTRDCKTDGVCGDNNACTVDTCNQVVGVCVHTAGNAGATCRTGAGVCDVAETCTGSSIDCPADQFVQSGVCRPATDVCDAPESCNGSGAGCPSDGVLPGGVCRPSAGQCDVAESCNGSSKSCPTDGFAPNGTSCTDGSACTSGDACQGGTCTPGDAQNCDDGNPCTDDGCDANGGCTHVNNSAPCSDGSECTTNDACSGGSCVGGPAPDCEDNNVCTDDSCNPSTPGGCVLANNTAPCNDGSDCTVNDTCGGGACAPGVAANCDDANACTTDACPGTAGCTHDPVAGPCCNVDADCADTDQCTINERCVNHQCVSDDRTCNDGNGCTDDSCNPSTPGGCVFADNNAPCSDGSECTTNDACSGGSCVGGTAPDCEDNNSCTDDSCNPTTPGGCEHVNNTAPCSDGSECTTNDACNGGSCVGGAAPSCDDGNGCTDDSCDPGTLGGCVHDDNTDPCSDGDGCTLDDVCSGGQCRSGAEKNCDDANICTDDSCSSPSGACVNAPNADPCSDGDVCTDNDSCFAGACQPGTPHDCNDHSACTDDVCTGPATGCEHSPVADEACCDVDADCADTDGCTVNERCVNNQCVSDPRDCADDDPCTIDVCDNSGGAALCTRTPCSAIQGQPCPEDHPECIPHRCGNTILEDAPPDNEQCDPPGSTMPNGQVCRTDCTFCGDGIKNGGDAEACDDGNSVTGCDPVHPQKALDGCNIDCKVPICEDPAKITLAEWMDRYDVHGRLPSSTLVDFGASMMTIELRSPRGKVLYRTTIEAGDLVGEAARGKYKYANKGAKAWGGLGKVKITRHSDGYRLYATTYGNLFNATDDMVTHVYSGDNHWTVRGDWAPTKKGWKFVE